MNTMTDDVARRLEVIFARLFPFLEGRDIRRAAVGTVRDWDAIATLSLIVEAEDEFGLAIGFDAAEDIETFDDLYYSVICARLSPFSSAWAGGGSLPC